MSDRLAAAALLIAFSSTVPAGFATPVLAAQGDVSAFDPDKDGTIDLKEAQAAASAAFDKLDPDEDGTLGKKEYLTLVETHFKAADPDNDGTIDARELTGPAGQALVQLMR